MAVKWPLYEPFQRFSAESTRVGKYEQVSRISKQQDEWQLQARYFYTKAASYADALADYQLTQSELDQNKANLEALVALRNRGIQLKGEAEEATRHRNQSIKALYVWIKEFKGIARIALQDSPQLLEALGIMVKAGRVA